MENDPAKLEAVKLWLNFLTSGEGTEVLWSAGTIPATDLSYVDRSTLDPFMATIFKTPSPTDAYGVPRPLPGLVRRFRQGALAATP